MGTGTWGWWAAGAAIAVALAIGCGLASSGNGPPLDRDPDGAPDDALGAADGAVTACTMCSSGTDAEHESWEPENVDGVDGPAADVPEASAPVDAGSEVEAETASQCNASCLANTCGGGCDQGSLCEQYFTCLVLCGFSDSATCTDVCNSQYPTAPFVAACAIACAAQCASSSGAGPDATAPADASAE